MKLPGPDHPITITANPKRVRVSAGGVVIADTTRALTLKEASYPAVQYVPREDANMALLARTFLGREATEEELSAMSQEMARDGQWIAPHVYGRDGGMFHLEPASFYSVLNAGSDR